MGPLCLRLVIALLLALAGTPALAEPPPPQPVAQKPSGFWTSPRPAQGGAYRYRLLGIGAALVLVTGLLTLRAVRKASASRSQRG